MTDLTRNGKFHEKKTYSVASAELDFSDFDGTNQLDLFNLPADCIVTNAHVIIKTAFDATRTFNVGFSGGAELISVGAASAVAVLTDALAAPLVTGTGKTVSLLPNAAVTVGKCTVIVEFIEPNLGCGNLMTVTN